MKINSKDISFIIQGPIQGTSFDRYENRYTFKLIESILNFFPQSEIIISTWEGQNAGELYYDKILYNKDPGSEIYIKKEGPLKNYRYNVNRQIVSTINGLKQSSRKYSCKIRSDLLFLDNSFLKYVDRYKNYINDYHFLKDRVLIINSTSVNPRKNYKFSYHPCDWFYFGLTEDLIKIWDIPLCKEDREAIWFEFNKHPNIHPLKYSLARYQAEQYIWKSFVDKNIKLKFDNSCDLSDDNIEKSEKIFAQNVCILDTKRLGLKNQRHKIGRIQLFNMYTFKQWEKLYYREQKITKKYFFFDSDELINKIFYYYSLTISKIYRKIIRRMK